MFNLLIQFQKNVSNVFIGNETCVFWKISIQRVNFFLEIFNANCWLDIVGSDGKKGYVEVNLKVCNCISGAHNPTFIC